MELVFWVKYSSSFLLTSSSVKFGAGHILALGRVDNPGNTFSLGLGWSWVIVLSLGIHFSNFAHSHLVSGLHSHSFLVGLCNVHVLGVPFSVTGVPVTLMTLITISSGVLIGPWRRCLLWDNIR